MHFENLKKYCVICFKYKSLHQSKNFRDVLKSNEEMIQEYLPEYQFSDETFPSVICNNCFLSILPNKKGKNYVQVYSYSDRNKKIHNFRNNDDCKCYICAKAKNDSKQKAPPIKMKKKGINKPKNSIKRCPSCLNEIGKGKRHQCNKENFIQNVVSLAKNIATSDALTSKLLIDKKPDNTKLVSLRNLRGKQSQVYIGKPSELGQMSTNAIISTQRILNLSDNATQKLTKNLKKER